MIGLSFCLGLVAFYVPERPYRVAPSIWLPSTPQLSVEQLAELPTQALPGQQGHVQFVGRFISSPELVEMPGSNAIASECPELFGVQASGSSRCAQNGNIGTTEVYTIMRRHDSIRTEAFMSRGNTLVAANGFYNTRDAVQFMQQLIEVPRRDVPLWLQTNNRLVDQAVATTQLRQQRSQLAANSAYQHIPFSAVLPAVLPADWVQQLTRIEGKDSLHPEHVAVYFKKGPERIMSLTLVARRSVTLGTSCGPIPDNGATISCGRVDGKDYYAGGYNQGSAMSWLLFRPMGDTMAILQVSAYNEIGQPLALSTQDLAAQKIMADSLQHVDKAQFKGAIFAGAAQDTIPELQPLP